MKKENNEYKKKNTDKKRPKGTIAIFVVLIILVAIAYVNENYELFQIAFSLLIIVTVYFRVDFPNDKVVNTISSVIIGAVIAFTILGLFSFIYCINTLQNCNSPV